MTKKENERVHFSKNGIRFVGAKSGKTVFQNLAVRAACQNEGKPMREVFDVDFFQKGGRI